MSYRLAIFDMDGTLLNSLSDLTNSVNFALAACGLPQRTEREVRAYTCNGLRRTVEQAMPEGASTARTDEVFRAFQEHYAVHCADLTAPYDGALDLLAALRSAGIKTAIISNKAEDAARLLCEKHFAGLIDYAAGARDGIRKKPAPDAVEAALKALGVPRGKAVCVGDSEVDIEMAANAGIDCIAVDWGFRDREHLAARGAGIIISDMRELARLILKGSA